VLAIGGAGYDPWKRICHGARDGGVVEVKLFGEAGDLTSHVVGWHGSDERRSGSHRVDPAFGVIKPAAPLLQLRVDHQIGQRPGVLGERRG
jgi:hypothetical protein